MLKTSLMLFAILIFSGCEWCMQKVEIPVEVKVPVKCIVPEPKKESCELKGLNDVEVVAKLIECIYAYQDASKVCK